jgi:hypothetical protein
MRLPMALESLIKGFATDGRDEPQCPLAANHNGSPLQTLGCEAKKTRPRLEQGFPGGATRWHGPRNPC